MQKAPNDAHKKEREREGDSKGERERDGQSNAAAAGERVCRYASTERERERAIESAKLNARNSLSLSLSFSILLSLFFSPSLTLFSYCSHPATLCALFVLSKLQQFLCTFFNATGRPWGWARRGCGRGHNKNCYRHEIYDMPRLVVAKTTTQPSEKSRSTVVFKCQSFNFMCVSLCVFACVGVSVCIVLGVGIFAA